MTANARMNPASILFVHAGEDWIRGSERCLLDLVKHLDRTRFAPVVCCNSPVLADAARQLGAPVYQVHKWDSAQHWGASLSEISLIRRLINRYRVSVIHTNDTDPIKAILPAARFARVPVVAHLHITISAEERRWSMLHQVTMAVGVSHAAVQGLLDDGFPASRARVVYNGIDPERLEQGDARGLRGELRIPETAVVFTALGSLIPRKGVDLTLEAFARLAARNRDCHLIFCGSGPERDHLRDRARALSLAGRVHLLGDRREAGAILRDATDVLVNASRQEAFPLNILEAAYFGRPIVASNIAPHCEFIGDGQPGLLFPSENAAALADALEALAGDAALRARLGAAGRARVRASHLVSHVVDQFDELYTSLLRRPSREFGWMSGTLWPLVTGRLTSVASKRFRRVLPGMARPPA